MNSDQVIDNISQTDPAGTFVGLFPVLVYAHGFALLYFLFGGRPGNKFVDCYRNYLTLAAIAFVAIWLWTGIAPTDEASYPGYTTFLALFPFVVPLLRLFNEVWAGYVAVIRRRRDDREHKRDAARQALLDAQYDRENTIRLEQERIENARQHQLTTVKQEQQEMNAEQHAKTLREMTMKVDIVYKQLESKLPSNVRGSEYESLKGKHLNQEHTVQELHANADSFILLLHQLHQEQLLESEKREIANSQAVDHHDMETAILYFQKRQEKISRMPIDEDDKERLIISLNEKREEVLDSYL